MDPSLFQKFDELAADPAPLSARREPRAHVLDSLRGLLADLPRKDCWTMAGHAGQARAVGLQRLLYQAVWDEDAALHAARRFAAGRPAAPDAVLVSEETGQEKKGEASAGISRLFPLFTHLRWALPAALATCRRVFHPQWSTRRRRHRAHARPPRQAAPHRPRLSPRTRQITTCDRSTGEWH